MSELIASSKCKFDGHSETLDGHDRDGSHEGADGYIDQGIRSAISRNDREYHHQTENEHRETIHEKPFTRV